MSTAPLLRSPSAIHIIIIVICVLYATRSIVTRAFCRDVCLVLPSSVPIHNIYIRNNRYILCVVLLQSMHSVRTRTCIFLFFVLFFVLFFSRPFFSPAARLFVQHFHAPLQLAPSEAHDRPAVWCRRKRVLTSSIVTTM